MKPRPCGVMNPYGHIMCTLSLFQEEFGGTRVVYGAFRLRESLSGSLSMSSMRQLIGTGLLESLGGEFGK